MSKLGLILSFYHDCDLTAGIHKMPLLKLNKTTSHKEQEHDILNEMPMVI